MIRQTGRTVIFIGNIIGPGESIGRLGIKAAVKDQRMNDVRGIFGADFFFGGKFLNKVIDCLQGKRPVKPLLADFFGTIVNVVGDTLFTFGSKAGDAVKSGLGFFDCQLRPGRSRKLNKNIHRATMALSAAAASPVHSPVARGDVADGATCRTSIRSGGYL